MSNILLALLFALLCFTQWQLSRQGTSLLCYLPTGLYLLIVGIASVRTILDDTFSLQAAVLLLTGLLILLAAGLIPACSTADSRPLTTKSSPLPAGSNRPSEAGIVPHAYSFRT